MTGNALHNGLKRVFIGLIVVAMLAQPIAPVIGSAAADDGPTTEPEAMSGPSMDLLDVDYTNNTTTTDNPCQQPGWQETLKDASNLWAPGLVDLIEGDQLTCEQYRELKQDSRADIFASLHQTERSQEVTKTFAQNNLVALRDNTWIRVEAQLAKEIDQNSTRQEAIENTTAIVNGSYRSFQVNLLRSFSKTFMDISAAAYSQHEMNYDQSTSPGESNIEYRDLDTGADGEIW
jgi:hypothetical protein